MKQQSYAVGKAVPTAGAISSMVITVYSVVILQPGITASIVRAAGNNGI